MNRIRELRKEKNWKQSDLGERLNVMHSAVSKYETEKIPLTDETLRLLSIIFNVSIDYILCMSDQRTPLHSKEESQEKITTMQHSLIQSFDRLDTMQQKTIFIQIQALATANKTEKENLLGGND